MTNYSDFAGQRVGAMKITLGELRARVPEEWQVYVAQYGPAFLAMTAEEIKAWLDLVIAGDVFKAYGDVLAKLPNADLLAEWGKLNTDWQTANAVNKARADLAKQALVGVMKVLVAIALAAVGL